MTDLDDLKTRLEEALTELRAERERVDLAIAKVESAISHLTSSRPSSLRRHRGWTSASRAKQAERMRAYWAARRLTA